MFTRSLSTPLRIWWKACKRFTFTTLSRVHFQTVFTDGEGYMIFATTFNREIFVFLNIVNMLLSPEKSGCDSSSVSVMAFQGTVVNKKFMSCEQLKSFLLSCHYVLWYVLPWKLVSQWSFIIQGDTTRKQPMTISHLLFKLTFKHMFIGTVLFSYIFAELRGTKKREFCPGWYEC